MEDGQVMLRTPGSLSTLSLLIRKCPTHYLAGDLPLTFSRALLLGWEAPPMLTTLKFAKPFVVTLSASSN
ncbi:hypothetical protein L915_05821 [Phytophthora nicotianae]|uniref:Uncharacterized protein n=3 Tax=Phytophthora nicotianae TaxID=4792 RepID=V9FHH1_PHYNI|nr:hypothetical protein F443_05944 [Phytophthora nicotianae P1569]ETK90416.1 hypothetical protein L915_05821 [Phytophthora nicotianae]ETO79279.1 hypothetical protein F444_05997 [Phytophthora nicotianae P1976]